MHRQSSSLGKKIFIDEPEAFRQLHCINANRLGSGIKYVVDELVPLRARTVLMSLSDAMNLNRFYDYLNRLYQVKFD